MQGTNLLTSLVAICIAEAKPAGDKYSGQSFLSKDRPW